MRVFSEIQGPELQGLRFRFGGLWCRGLQVRGLGRLGRLGFTGIRLEGPYCDRTIAVG